ncbi:MAG: aromatic ring-hydroxylating dioxygenase subunit alpha [Pseudomonadota bacterium]
MNAPESFVRSLEADYYTNPEIFHKERRGLLARTWQFAGHVSQAEKPGDYFAFHIAGQNLFCIRGRDGVLRTFFNVCQHRAHELVAGNGNCKVIVCPYHAWSYDLTGGLRAAPNHRSMANFPRAEISLTEVRTELLWGFVFVNLDPQAKPMDDCFPGVRDELKAFVPQIEDLKPLEWIGVTEKCNWKVSVENYSECYHCSLNHPTFATGVVKPETYNIRPQGYCLRHTTECQNLDRMSYPIDLQANAHAGDYSSWFLWPTFSFQVYPGNVLNTYHWRPNAVDEVEVWRGWYSIDGIDSEVIRRLAVQDRATTVEEDIHLVESVQRGLNSQGYKPGPLMIDPREGVSSEHSIKALQQWMREGVEP